MNPKPLKGKLKCSVTEDSDLNPEYVFELKDVRSAVEWLKVRIKLRNNWLTSEVIEQIDRAFEDVSKDE